MFGFFLFLFTTILQALLRPTQTVEGPRLDDLSISTADYGRVLPVIYGSMRVGTNVIWGLDLIEQSETETQGNFLTGKTKITEFFYFSTFSVSVCEGPVDAVTRIWANGELIFDRRDPTDSDAQAVLKDGIDQGTIRIRLGGEGQIANPDEVDDKGEDRTPAYRGVCVIDFHELPLEDYGNRIPEIEVEVVNGPAVWPSEQSNLGSVGASHLYARSVYQPGDLSLLHFTNDAKFHIVDVPARQLISVVERSEDWERGFGNGSIAPMSERGWRFIWRSIGLDGGDPAIGMFDAWTGELLGDAPWDGDSNGTSGALVAGSGTAERLYQFNTQNNGRLNLFKIQVVDPLTGEFAPDFLRLATSTDFGDGPSPFGLVEDKNGDVWIAATSGDDVKLTKLAVPGSGRTSLILGADDAQFTLSDMGFTNIFYDPDRHAIVFWRNGENEWVRWDIASESIDLRKTGPGSVSRSETLAAFRLGPVDGFLWLRGGSSFERVKIDVDTMEVVETHTSDSNEDQWQTNTAAGVYDPINHAWIDSSGADNPPWWLFLDRHSDDGVTLASIVDDISDRVGIAAGDRDTADLTGTTVHGYARGQRMAARRALEPLQRAYLFDGVESDHQMKFLLRGKDTVADIAEDDLGAHSGGEPPPRLETQRAQDLELPRRVDVTFADPGRDYQRNSVGVLRADDAIASVDKKSIELPVAMTPTEAIQAAERILYSAWMGRHERTFQVGPKHLRLDPGDAVAVTVDGVQHTVHLEEVTIGQNFVLECKGVDEEAATYVSAALGDGGDFTAQTITVLPLSALHLLDIPLLRDGDDALGLGFYLGAGPIALADVDWPGATVYRESGEGDLQAWQTLTEDVVHGITESTLADGPSSIWDRSNSVTVQLYDGATLVSQADIDVLNGANMAVIGEEIIHFADVADLGDGRYTLSRLIRGVRGTEWAIAGHGDRERVRIITDANLLPLVGLPTSELSTTRDYAVRTLGAQRPVRDRQSLTFKGRVKMPYAPVHIAGSKDESDDWTLTWTRRTRVEGHEVDGQDVPLGEASEAYEVDILDGSTVVRTLEVTSESATYTSAQQTEDFGSAQESLDIEVYQISEVVGRGFKAEATVGG